MLKQLIRIATRKSPLALWQANYVGNLIKSHWANVSIELVPMLTSGDRFNKDKLLEIGGKGLFVKELEEALLDNRADLAVHSMKDVPAELPRGLTMTAICKRDNPFDVLVCRTNTDLQRLPYGSTIGTSSLRRQSQLLAYRPDFIIKTLRGNIHTRLNQLENNTFDAIILAAAGLERMGIESHSQSIITTDIMLPACAQGALGIECRTADTALQALIAPLNDLMTATCVYAERHVNARLGGNCHVPLAVFCQPEINDELTIQAKVLTADGKKIIHEQRSGAVGAATQLANECANSMLANGAKELLLLS